MFTFIFVSFPLVNKPGLFSRLGKMLKDSKRRRMTALEGVRLSRARVSRLSGPSVRFALALAPITEGDKINLNEIERGKPELA